MHMTTTPVTATDQYCGKPQLLLALISIIVTILLFAGLHCRNRRPVVDIVVHRDVRDPLKQASELKGAKFHGDPCAPVSPEDWPEELR